MRNEFGRRHIVWLTVMASVAAGSANALQGDAAPGSYQDLVALFTQWRAFEQPPDREGAPDYTAATFTQRHAELN